MIKKFSACLLSAVLLPAILALSLTSCTLPASLTGGTAKTGNSSGQTTVSEKAAQTGETSESSAAQQETTLVAGGKTVKVTLYFPTEDNSAVKKEERQLQVVNGAILKAAAEALLKGPETSGLHNAIPEGTVLNGVNLKNKVAIVDFSKEFGTANGIAGVVEIISVVNTLTGITGVEKVRFHINGKDMIGLSGMPMGDVGPTKLNDNGFPLSSEKKNITLYFGNSDADKVIPEKREVEVFEGELLEKVIFNELMKGPATEGLHATIPKGTRLLSAKTANGLCTLDLSKEFIDNSPGGTAGESMTLNSVVNSLTELSSIKKVQFLIEGKKREVYTHVVFNLPFSRNENIIGSSGH